MAIGSKIILGSEEILGPKRFRVSGSWFGSERVLSAKNLSQRKCESNKFWVKKCGPGRKHWYQKFWVNKFWGKKKSFESKTLLVQNILAQKFLSV